MQAITTIGFDIAKSVFQVHCVDAEGKVILRRQLKRRYVLAFFQKLPPCVVGIEACASSHHWSRELQALGHIVRLMPPAYVKPSHSMSSTPSTICSSRVTRSRSRRMILWRSLRGIVRMYSTTADSSSTSVSSHFSATQSPL